MKFKVKEKNLNQRLDKFLTEQVKNKTRSQIKKMVKEGLVLINSKKAKVHHFLKPGDEVVINEAPKILTVQKEKKQEKLIEPEIIFEDEDFLVINKPSGILVHATDKGETNTLVDWLKNKYPDIETVREEKQKSKLPAGGISPLASRAGIVHRLDKDVSGVMVIAKNNKMFNHLKTQFQERKVIKHYTALVYGRVPKTEGQIDLPIGRNKDGQFVAHPKKGREKYQATDKVAKTNYSVLEYIKDYSLLDVQILTGRTHQIRAHLFAIGHPIIGDQIYKPKKKFLNLLRTKIKVIELPRIFLHSTKLGFYDLTGKFQEFNSSLPNNLTNFLNDQKTK